MVTAGATGTFSVTASGSGTLGYEWQKNGTAIAGATSASYTTPATVVADSGASFTVVVSNSAGNVTSSVASLTVNGGGPGAPPAISGQPQSQTVQEGTTATFSVIASGTGTLSYQWTKNGVAISGATGASYTTPAAIVADSGEAFTVVVTGPTGQVTSNAAVLTVTAVQAGNADPQGVYYGSLKFNSQQTAWPLFAIVLKNGTAAVFAIQSYATGAMSAGPVPIGIGLQGVQVVTSGSSFTSSFTAHTQTGYVLTNGQTSATGTITGTVNPGVSITGTFTSTLDDGTFTMTASSVSYAASASLGAIAGTYHHSYAVFSGSSTIYNATELIFTDGTGSGTDNASCTYTGTYAAPDANHNAYNVTTHSTCGTQSSATYSGIAAFFPAGSAAGAALNTALNGVGQGATTGLTNFATDTVVSVADNGTTAYMIFASK